jgi:FtsH-binding integral membrane protein
MYGKMSVASGTIATGALLVAGMRAVAWAIAGGFVVVLAGITLYRLATIKARR